MRGCKENLQRQTETCRNLRGQVGDGLRADPSRIGPVWTGPGMNQAAGTHPQTETERCGAAAAPLPVHPAPSAEQRPAERTAASGRRRACPPRPRRSEGPPASQNGGGARRRAAELEETGHQPALTQRSYTTMLRRTARRLQSDM